MFIPTTQAGDTPPYPSSTLPLTKQEKKWSHESRPLGLAAPQQPLNPVQPPPSMRRASVATANIVPPYNLQAVEGKGTLPPSTHSQVSQWVWSTDIGVWPTDSGVQSTATLLILIYWQSPGRIDQIRTFNF